MCVKVIGRMFHVCFKEVLRKLQECFKGVEKDVLKVFTASFKVIAGKWHK